MPQPRPARATQRARCWAPTVALTAAGLMLATSLFLPYWKMSMATPSHPAGLDLVSYLDHIEGPLETVLASAGRSTDARLRELSELERSLAVATATVICLLVVAATFVHNRWAALLSLPALAFPVIVVADTARWLRPIVSALSAAAGASGPPPTVLLFGRIAWGETVLETRPGAGLFLATAASITVIGGLWLHRRAYKPGVGGTLDDSGKRELAERAVRGAL